MSRFTSTCLLALLCSTAACNKREQSPNNRADEAPGISVPTSVTGLVLHRPATGITAENLANLERVVVPKDAILVAKGPFSSEVIAWANKHDIALSTDCKATLPSELKALWCEPGVTDADLANLAKLTHLETLGVVLSPISDAGLKQIAKLAHLRVLDATGTNITDAGVDAHLPKLARLETLVLANTQITNRCLGTLTSLPALATLDLAGMTINSADGLTGSTLPPFPRLRALSVAQSEISSLLLIISLVNTPSIETLTLAGTNASDSAFENTYLPSLTFLNVSKTSITDAGLGYISELTTLTSLNLSATNVTDAGMPHLANLARLSSLDLSAAAGVTDAGLFHLQKLASLRELTLMPVPSKLNDEVVAKLASGKSSITNAGLAHLAKMPGLTALSLVFVQVTDDGLAQLAALGSLEKFTLLPLPNNGVMDVGEFSPGNSPVTGRGLAHLSKVTSLRAMHVGYVNISDDELQRLATSMKLTELSLFKTSVTARGCEAFNKQLGRVVCRRLDD